MIVSYLPTPGTPVEEFETPSIVVDLDVAEENIRKMQSFADKHGMGLRPHSKTHKSPYWAHRQLEAGAVGITCSKVGEAEVLVDGGVREVLIANEIVGAKKISRLAALEKRANVVVAVDSVDNARELSEAAGTVGVETGVLVDVNVRIARCGVEPGEPSTTLAKVADGLPGLRFDGLMGYEGHVTAGEDEKRQIVHEAMDKFKYAKDEVESAGLPVKIMSAGGTSTYMETAKIDHVTEIQCGSYVFMDGKYLDEMSDFDLAITVASTVISRPAPERAILDIGRKSMNAETGLPRVVSLPGATLVGLNEEHGILQLEAGAQGLRVGDQVHLVPMTASTTINIHDFYFCVRNRILEDVVPVAARGRFW
jgi:D-serine deaminase-like pyridoxal phosphate-dependent protein